MRVSQKPNCRRLKNRGLTPSRKPTPKCNRAAQYTKVEFEVLRGLPIEFVAVQPVSRETPRDWKALGVVTV